MHKNRKLICPRCENTELQKKNVKNIEIDFCPECSGIWFDEGELEIMLGDKFSYQKIYNNLFPVEESFECPSCGVNTVKQEYRKNRFVLYVESCPYCKGFWLDGGELDQLLSLSQAFKLSKRNTLRPVRVEESPDEVGEVIRHYTYIDIDEIGDEKHLTAAIYFFCLLSQSPYEIYNPRKYFPTALFGLIILNIYIFIHMLDLEIESLIEFLSVYGLVPSSLFTGFNFHQLVTHAFLHGGMSHLLLNMYFIWIFGDNIYDLFAAYGRKKGALVFTTFYLIIAVCGGLAHSMFSSFSETMKTMPLVGASGAASGLLAAYWRKFPRSRFYQVILVFPFKVRVSTYMSIWLMSNIYMAFRYGIESQVSWLAHMGGFAAGYLLINRFIPEKLKNVEL
ncbi:MAG: rhomboid family intramembrane serine protease [Candidatus Muiribacteriota bacterium]